jgi:caffeoyl-CoA O-methyltransferase
MHLVSEQLEKYIDQFSSPEDAVLSELSRETYLKIQMPQMVSGNLQGQFLEMLSRLIQPKRILEVGTFTGYSAICLAKGLTDGGLLYTIDVNEELQPICARYFEKANLTSKIKHLIGDAQKLIPVLNETFDLVFIDADKINYSIYYDLAFDKLRVGGFIIADNVLWSGKVIEEKKDKDTVAIHQYNQKVSSDARVKNFILSLRDGLNIAQKIS